MYTHAFFKACLFLGAGSVIHAMSGEQDIRKMGGLARKIPVTFVTFAVATAAIAGIPPLAGFFSKDEILWFAFASERGGSPLLWIVASFTALMTAFYMFRLLMLTFLTPSRMDEKTAHHVHESPFSMTGVLIVLAVLSAIGGFFHVYHFLEPVMPMPAENEALEHLKLPLVIFAVVTGLTGLAAAVYVYGRGLARADRLQQRFAGLHRLLSGKYYVDELVRGGARPAAALDLRAGVPRPRRPGADRRHAARPDRPRPARRRAPEPRRDRQPAVLRAARGAGRGRLARMDVGPWLSPPC